jgi:hypothetical protein
MQHPQTRKDVQKLTGIIIALNKFVAKLAKQSLPFFTILMSFAKIEWGQEQHRAFNNLKSYLHHLLTLSSPKQSQPLILYVSATHSAVSGALVQEKEVTKNGKTSK